MNKHTETQDGAYVVVTTRATGRIRLHLGHAIHLPIDKVEMSAQQAREVANGLMQAANLLEVNAGAGVRSAGSPQRSFTGANDASAAQLGRLELRVGLLIAATAASVYLYVDFLGHAVGWW